MVPRRMPARYVRVLSAALIAAVSLLSATAEAQLPSGEPGKPVSPILAMTQAVGAYRKGDYADARERFQKLVTTQARNSTAHYYLALCHARLGDDAKAVAELDLAVRAGYQPVDGLAVDPELEDARKRDAIRTGIATILERERKRRAGIVDPPRRIDLQKLTEFGLEEAPLEPGRVHVIAFIERGFGDQLYAAYAAQRAAAAHEDVDAMVYVRINDKTYADKERRRFEFVRDTGLEIDVRIADPEIEAVLEPFRHTPTILVVDREGRAVRLVERWGRSAEERIEAMVDDVVAGRKPVDPVERAKPESRPSGSNEPEPKDGDG